MAKRESMPTNDDVNLADEGAHDLSPVDQAMSEIDPSAPPADVENLESVEQLRHALVDAQAKALRSQAELENFRKRTRREQSDQLRYAMMPLIRDLLPVLDNFQRAMAAITVDEANRGMIEGIGMVAQQIAEVLGQHGCQEIAAAGQSFDPMAHEAVAQYPSDNVPAGQILEVVQTGYRLHDRVIRPSQVIVSQGPVSAE